MHTARGLMARTTCKSTVYIVVIYSPVRVRMGQCLHVHVSPPRVCTLALWYLAAVGNGEVSNFVHNWLQEIVIKAKDFLSNHYPPFHGMVNKM